MDLIRPGGPGVKRGGIRGTGSPRTPNTYHGLRVDEHTSPDAQRHTLNVSNPRAQRNKASTSLGSRTLSIQSLWSAKHRNLKGTPPHIRMCVAAATGHIHTCRTTYTQRTLGCVLYVCYIRALPGGSGLRVWHMCAWEWRSRVNGTAHVAGVIVCASWDDGVWMGWWRGASRACLCGRLRRGERW